MKAFTSTKPGVALKIVSHQTTLRLTFWEEMLALRRMVRENRTLGYFELRGEQGLACGICDQSTFHPIAPSLQTAYKAEMLRTLLTHALLHYYRGEE